MTVDLDKGKSLIVMASRETETGIYPKVYLHTYEAAYVQSYSL